MKLRELHFDDVVVIPGYTEIAGGITSKRETTFHADDGWVLDEISPGRFSISRDDMTEPVTVGGFGYSFVRMPTGEALEDASSSIERPRKGKR